MVRLVWFHGFRGVLDTYRLLLTGQTASSWSDWFDLMVLKELWTLTGGIKRLLDTYWLVLASRDAYS